jgi:hypothetical protein
MFQNPEAISLEIILHRITAGRNWNRKRMR